MFSPAQWLQAGLVLLGVLYGLCLGSFTTAIIYRESKNKSWFSLKGHAARSYCPECKTNLKPVDLIPVASWLFLRGKCRYCKSPISFLYPAIELTAAGITLCILLACEFRAEAFIALMALPFILAIIHGAITCKRLSQRLIIVAFLVMMGAFFVHLSFS